MKSRRPCCSCAARRRATSPAPPSPSMAATSPDPFFPEANKTMKTLLISAALTLAAASASAADAPAASPEQGQKLTLELLAGGTSLNAPGLMHPELSPDGRRLSFLRGKAEDKNRLDLWEIDVATGKEQLLVDSNLLQKGPEQLSDAEKARRERQ